MKRMGHGAGREQTPNAIDGNGEHDASVLNQMQRLRKLLATSEARLAEALTRVDRLLVSNCALAEELKAVKAALACANQIVHHDPLTGLPNRTLLLDHLHRAITHCARRGRQCALLFLDVDGFKAINDSCGHQAGDEVLRRLAQRLELCVRADDIVGRLSGDEFLLLLPEIESLDDAVQVAQKVHARSAAPYTVATRELRVTLSIGIAVFPDNGSDAESLLGSADVALYRAKAGFGARQTPVYASGFQESALETGAHTEHRVQGH